MSTNLAVNKTAELTNKYGKKVSLTNVDIKAELIDLMSKVTIQQTYKNLEEKNIEAVYTFPLPVDAVLLDLIVTLGDKVLHGKVIERKQAEEKYEEAITDGDTAIMLQEIDSGMLTMNVGNIMAGETIEIQFTYGVLHSYQDKNLRFLLPTTIAPRYGDPITAGLEAHQTPEHEMLVDYGFNFEMVVKGVLANAKMKCPTHPILTRYKYSEQEKIAFGKNIDQITINLKNLNAVMDKDFVLNFDNIPVNKTVARVENDHHGYVALASFLCDFNLQQEREQRSLKVMVDCSGSMSGDSIQQARIALVKMLSQLRDGDLFNIIKFGSNYSMLANEQICLNEMNRQNIRQYIENIGADMGGTEMSSALDATYQLSKNLEITHDILLITDGEVWDEDNMLNKAARSSHRIFTIGVGNSVAENIVRGLAAKTGGVCELVTPNESMSEKIVRHFKRIYAPKANNVWIEWPNKPIYQYPQAIKSIFDGDTLHAFGWFKEIPKGEVILKMELQDGRIIEEVIQCQALDFKKEDYQITRMGIAKSFKQLDGEEDKLSKNGLYLDKDKAELAVEYQLMTEWTNYLVVLVRSEKDQASELPELRKVPQTLAAGWSGLGVSQSLSAVEADCGIDVSLEECCSMLTPISRNKKLSSRTIKDKRFHSADPSISSSDLMDQNQVEALDYESLVEEEIIHEKLENNTSKEETVSLNMFIDSLDARLNGMSSDEFNGFTVVDFESIGMPPTLLYIIKEAVHHGHDEQLVLDIFLQWLLASDEIANLNRANTRLIRWRTKSVELNDTFVQELIESLSRNDYLVSSCAS